MQVQLTITAAEAAPIVMKAYDDRLLVAQAWNLSAAYAAPRSNGDPTLCRCAIGALYPPEVAIAMEMPVAGKEFWPELAEQIDDARAGIDSLIGPQGPGYMVVRQLLTTGMLIVPEEEQGWFMRLQNLHDAWCDGDRDNRAYHKKAFLDHLKAKL